MKKFFNYLMLLIIAITVIFPIFTLAMGSMMDKYELMESLLPLVIESEGYAKFLALPNYPTIINYIELLLDSPEYFIMFWNSVKMSFIPVFMQLIIAAPAAWAFGRYDFKFKSILFTVYIVLMLMPFQVTMVSSYLTLDKLKLIDTIWSVILPSAFSAFPVFIITKFFSDIPKETFEAAELDGANELQIFLKIGIPLGRGGLISAAVLGFLECWNAIEPPLTFLQDKSLWPLSLYLPEINIATAGVAFAASIIMLMPCILIFLAGQGYVEQGIQAAGLKG